MYLTENVFHALPNAKHVIIPKVAFLLNVIFPAVLVPANGLTVVPVVLLDIIK